MFTALQATSLTLLNLFETRFESDLKLRSFFNAAFGGSMIVSLNSPQELTNDINQQGLSVWLYQMVRDPERLNMLPEKIGPAEYRRVPLPIRLHYMMTPLITPSESSPETEQMILGKVLQILHDRPTLRGADLKGDFTNKDIEITARLENLSVEQISQVFYSLDRSLQLSVSYEISVVYIESELEPQEGPPVQTVLSRYGVEVNGS